MTLNLVTQVNDSFGAFEDDDDDFGDFGDENDDFGDFDSANNDFGDFENDNDFGGFTSTSQPPKTNTFVPELPLSLGDLSSDIMDLFPDLAIETEAATPDSEKTKEIKELFDCVNASSLEHCWRNSYFDKMLSAATPMLIEICKSESVMLCNYQKV